MIVTILNFSLQPIQPDVFYECILKNNAEIFQLLCAKTSPQSISAHKRAKLLNAATANQCNGAVNVLQTGNWITRDMLPFLNRHFFDYTCIDITFSSN